MALCWVVFVCYPSGYSLCGWIGAVYDVPFSSTRSPPAMISPSFHMNLASCMLSVSSSSMCCISGKLLAIRIMLSAHMMWLHSLPSMWYPIPSSLHLVIVVV